MKRALAAGAAAATPAAAIQPRPATSRAATKDSWDIAVVGAGVFGVWTAYALARAGQRVALLDGYGPGNSRATSGGETRIIRISYGSNQLYSEWTLRSLSAWKALSAETGIAHFVPTGVLRLASDEDRYTEQSADTLARLGVRHELLGKPELERRFPQIGLDGIAFGLYEPDSGSLLARRSVQAVADRCRGLGAALIGDAALAPQGKGVVSELHTRGGQNVHAGKFVFACGPWLPRLFPDLLGSLIEVTRAEVFFLGVPAGEHRFSPLAMPAWIDNGADTYGVADIEHRGFKIGLDPPRTPSIPTRRSGWCRPSRCRACGPTRGSAFRRSRTRRSWRRASASTRRRRAATS